MTYFVSEDTRISGEWIQLISRNLDIKDQYISLFVMKTEKKNKNKHEQLSITNRIQCTIMHKQKQHYVRHLDLNTSRIGYFSELTGSLSGILVS